MFLEADGLVIIVGTDSGGNLPFYIGPDGKHALVLFAGKESHIFLNELDTVRILATFSHLDFCNLFAITFFFYRGNGFSVELIKDNPTIKILGKIPIRNGIITQGTNYSFPDVQDIILRSITIDSGESISKWSEARNELLVQLRPY